MKVKDLVSKIRIAKTPIEFIENGKMFAKCDMETLMNYYSNPAGKYGTLVMDRTVNTFEIKNDTLLIWVKPLT
jgi:hypothetical protein